MESPARVAEAEPLLLERRGATAWLTLNRPAQRNALSRELLKHLGTTIDELARDDGVRVIVLAANGPIFSSGHDLREIGGATESEAEAIFRLCADVMRSIREAPQPVIARVHGLATAAGCQMVAACDLAVAAESARFATPGVSIGLFCSTPAVPLVRAIGRKRALEMLLTAEPISAHTACDWGLVNRVVPDGELDAAVEQIAARIEAASRSTIALGKRGFYHQLELPESEAYDFASGLMCDNSRDADAHEGIDAFLKKRKPVWRS
jgi:enoyl-CoA hydratase/carnithine racemase